MQETKCAVIGPDGLIGYVSSHNQAGSADHVRVSLVNGTDVLVAACDLIRQEGSYSLAAKVSGIGSPEKARTEEAVVPVIAEELVVIKRLVTTGGVRVHKTVQEHEEIVAMPLQKEHVDIRRVVIGRDVEGPMPIRREGEVTIIPVVEEVFVVEKRMRLIEEFHITRTRREEHSEQAVTLQRETVVVERLDTQGQASVEEIQAETMPDVVRPVVPSGTRPLRRNKIIRED